MSSKIHDTWRVSFCLAVLCTSLCIMISNAFAVQTTTSRRVSRTQESFTQDAGLTSAADDSGPDANISDNSHSTSAKQLQLALAKVCVSESGFQVRTNDCTLIYHVLRGRSTTGELTMGIMRAYAKKTFDERRQDSRRWILHLNHTFEEPREWSETVTIPWSVRRSGFIDVYTQAGELVRTRPNTTPCGAKVSHWGARGFRRELHLNQGWQLVRCGTTHNDFWYVPSRKRSEETDSTLVQEVASL